MLDTCTRPASDLRDNYQDVIQTLKEHNYIIITNNGVEESVLISIDRYEQYEKLMYDRYVYEELQKSKASLDDPSAVFHDADDVHEMLEKWLVERGL